SQLSQLKSALSTAGLNSNSRSKKDKKAGKKSGVRDADRSKTFERLEEIRRGLNKFDVRETKLKHDVGGRNLKGVVGRPSASKQAGLEQRKKTLLPEHHLRGHTGSFRDRRFGEADPTMSLEDRMLERYTRERQRGQGKKGLFNLEDDDAFGLDDDEGLGGLTHGGRSVLDLPTDDFVKQGLAEEDEEGKGTVDAKTVHRVHFGGFEREGEEDGEERKKSKAEVMSELIAKSKGYKHERQQQKELDIDLREELDEDIDELRALLQDSAPASGPSTLSRRMQLLKEQDEQDADGNYDQVVKTLAFDARAKPKNRTKTEEELAVEEKERLEEAEAKRLKRMRGEPDSDEEEEGDKRRKTEKRGEADDLDDDFGEELLGPGSSHEGDENLDEENDEDETDDDEEDEEEDENQDTEEFGDEDEDDDEDEDEEDDQDMDEPPDLVPVDETDLVKSKKIVRVKTTPAVKEIPFTFPCPATVDELEDVLSELDDSALPIVIQRIRALHHPSLAQGNKEKLQDFLGVLIDYTLLLASHSPPSFSLITSLLPHITSLVKLNPLSAAPHFLSKLSLMQKNLSRGLSKGASSLHSRTYPGTPELVLLRLIGAIWSTSDFSHPVSAPAMILMGQYLGQSRIRQLSDVASGLFLCSLLAEYEKVSKRLVPESLNFISATLSALLPRKSNTDTKISLTGPDLLAEGTTLTLVVSEKEPNEPVDLNRALGWGDEMGKEEIEQGKVDLLVMALKLIKIYAELYASSEAFVELFTPLLQILQSSKISKLSSSIKTLHQTIILTLTRQLHLANTSRQPLALQSHKPIPIPSYAPKFEADFTPGKHYDPDVERNAGAKLRALYKKERKGAIRELRKDNRFLAGEKSREQSEKDVAYASKMRKVEGSLQVERAEEKQMQREKMREKRRAGRK
ncbi:hypothetical protein TREMEDRAFT_20830, partial [Tremella mesenterica DSM 1558]|uniref:uncharacterized protein n=1 Tax=Tremella mesenterica (strain ATCC 24925 / CBS 8224 / DSM 1558 / NBRC 9311 / NRRL Y-6157 / RJB 2259-6 / UBC 559-6) TaxID=578456 RepID=UPI0003F491BA